MNPRSVEVIGWNGFWDCNSHSEMIVESVSHLRVIRWFHGCKVLSRIAISSSIETLFYAFRDCISLSEVIFESGHLLREIDGFNECTAISRIAIPCSTPTPESFDRAIERIQF
jgi:hypothetical protein